MGVCAGKQDSSSRRMLPWEETEAPPAEAVEVHTKTWTWRTDDKPEDSRSSVLTAQAFRMDRKQYCVKLSVQPSRGLADEKFIVLVQNVPPGFQLTVHSLHKCEDGHSWEAFGHFTANASGVVNVSEDLSLGGTYCGVEQMGLLWSIRPVPGSKPWIRLRKTNVQTPMEFTISVYQGHQTEGFADRVPLAAVVVERWYMAPGVRRFPITESGLTATLFLPPGPGPFPGLLDLWGGGGKLVEYRAALLASHGFACLALDYMTPKITMETGKMVGNDYFETAYRLLEQHPQVLGSRIGMLGLSFGTSMTLKMAVHSQVMKLSCVVCISGSHVQPVDGDVEQIIGYFILNAGKTRFTEENHMIWRDLLLPIPTDLKLKVDVGRLRCPVLLVVGEDDQNWPAHESALDMKEMMERAGNNHLLTLLSYPNAGHLIEPPYSPHVRSSAFRSVSTREKVVALWGGETVAHCHAQEDAWRKMLVFLRDHLYAGTNPGAASFSNLSPEQLWILQVQEVKI
uniref:peroxisomal succinyl-coenzyme A thioesterase-like isoform X2 n=1 Tax=Scatophagus argus TaxID=75038 RepID=UPI001ED8602A|nr:peroxisomal succinyl-coenzyme A thioesterase-like isoform X2 [Scatophagus argus]